jgi:excisionase family DNA binding protein
VPRNEEVPVPRLAYRVAEVAAAWGITRWSVNRLIAEGELAATKVGSITLITAAELDAYLQRHTTRATRRDRPGDQAEDVAG